MVGVDTAPPVCYDPGMTESPTTTPSRTPTFGPDDANMTRKGPDDEYGTQTWAIRDMVCAVFPGFADVSVRLAVGPESFTRWVVEVDNPNGAHMPEDCRLPADPGAPFYAWLVMDTPEEDDDTWAAACGFAASFARRIYNANI